LVNEERKFSVMAQLAGSGVAVMPVGSAP